MTRMFLLVVESRLLGLGGAPWARDEGELAPDRAKADTDPQGAMPNLGSLDLGLVASPVFCFAKIFCTVF